MKTRRIAIAHRTLFSQESWLRSRSHARKLFSTSCVSRKWISVKEPHYSVYTGPFKYHPSSTFYSELANRFAAVEEDEHDSFVSPVESVCGRGCSQLQYQKGDLVEIRSRDGSMIDLGLVYDYFIGGSIRVLTIDGSERLIKNDDVSFVMRGVFGKANQTSLQGLRKLVKDAYQVYTKMKPYWPVACAQRAFPDFTRSCKLELLARQAFRAARHDSDLNAVRTLAAYIGFSNAPQLNRLSNDSPLFIKSDSSMDLCSTIDEVSDPEHINQFLHYNDAFPDYRNADSASKLTSKLSEGSQSNPVRGPYSVFDTSSSTIDDSMGPKLTKRFEQAKTKSFDPIKRTMIQEQVFAFTDHPDIAFSLNTSKRHVWTLSIHVPDISIMTSSSRPIVSNLLDANKTIKYQEKERPLVPYSVRETKGFATPGFKLCLSFSIDLEPWQPTVWDISNVTVTHTAVDQKLNIYDPDEMELALGWKYRQIGESVFDESDFHQVSAPIPKLRQDTLKAIRDLFDKFSRERMSRTGATISVPDSNLSFESPAHSPIESMIQEARVTAGQICAMFAAYNSIALPFLTQRLNTTDQVAIKELTDRIANSPVCGLILQSYLGPETLRPINEPHHGLGAAQGYVDVTHPFDSVVSIYCQWILRRELLKRNDSLSGREAAALASLPEQLTALEFIEEVSGQSELIDWQLKRATRYDKLKQIESNQINSNGYHIFRCTVTRPAVFPQLAQAYCEELAIEVEIALVPNTSVDVGDRVVCNEILELSAVDGLLVLCM